MQKFKYRAPYKKNGKTNFPETSKKTGVYLIKKNDKIIYIGYFAYDLYKTIYRHFQEWNDKDQPTRITYKNQLSRENFTIRVVYCSNKRAAALEKALILKHLPKDNKIKYTEYLKNTSKTEENYINSIKQIYEFAPILNEAPF